MKLSPLQCSLIVAAGLLLAWHARDRGAAPRPAALPAIVDRKDHTSVAKRNAEPRCALPLARADAALATTASLDPQPTDLAEICARIDDTSDSATREECYCEEISAWIAASSHFAAKELAEVQVSSLTRIRVTAQIMAEQDFVAAYCWADRLDNPDERSAALGSVIYQAARVAPSEMYDFASQADLGAAKPLVLRTLAARASRTELEPGEEGLAPKT